MSRPVICATRVVLLLLSLLASPVSAAERWTVGLTTSGAPIDAFVVPGPSAASPTVLLVGGLTGKDQSAEAVAREVAGFEALAWNRRRFRLIAIPIANPEAQPLQFPPTGAAYR